MTAPATVNVQAIVAEKTEVNEVAVRSRSSADIDMLEQAVAVGLQEGLHAGRMQGLRRIVFRQLQLKFGELDQDAEARILAADEDTLERYGERVLSAQTLSELFADDTK